MQANATALSSYSKEERWQLPGLTGQDAFQPEEWHNFRTKVSDTVPQGEPSNYHACSFQC